MANVDIGSILDSIENSDPLAIDLKKRTRDALFKLGVPLKQAEFYASVVGFSVGLVLAAVGLIISIVINVADPLLRVFLRVLTKVRTDSVPEQVDISAAVLSEFLATEIDPSHIKTGKTGDQTINAARAIGGALIDRLTKEFDPGGIVTPESGEKAAKTFTGYGVNFAVQNEMLGTLADALSFHLLEGFRELGAGVARNLGMGRLNRQVLGTLVRNLIQEPYDQALRKRYRPDLLTEAHAVNAFYGGFIDDSTIDDILARKGYSNTYIPIVKDQNRAKLTEGELSLLLRFGEIGPALAKDTLARSGWDATQSAQKLRVKDLERGITLIDRYRDLISKQAIDGLLDDGAYNDLLNALPLPDEEKQREKDFVNQSRAFPRKFLTWTELEEAFTLGAVDLDYVTSWLNREGYDDTAQFAKIAALLKDLEAATKVKTPPAKNPPSTGG